MQQREKEPDFVDDEDDDEEVDCGEDKANDLTFKSLSKNERMTFCKRLLKD